MSANRLRISFARLGGVPDGRVSSFRATTTAGCESQRRALGHRQPKLGQSRRPGFRQGEPKRNQPGRGRLPNPSVERRFSDESGPGDAACRASANCAAAAAGPCSSAHAPRPCHGNPGRATTDTCGAKSYVEERTGHFEVPSNKKPKLNNSEIEPAKVRAPDEARQNVWDTKTKKSMSGICVGC